LRSPKSAGYITATSGEQLDEVIENTGQTEFWRSTGRRFESSRPDVKIKGLRDFLATLLCFTCTLTRTSDVFLRWSASARRAASSIPHSSLRPIFIDLEDSRDMFFLRLPVVSAGSRSGLVDCDRMVIVPGYSARAGEIMKVAI
jgi:hypothetical protein